MIKRYRVSWTNFPGAPGVSTHYFADTVTDFTPVRTFYTEVIKYIPNGTTIQFPTTVDLLDETTGLIQTVQTATSLASLASIVPAAPFSGASGAITQWRTPDFVDGKHVVGRTYIVPLAQSFYDNTGSINSTMITGIQNAGATFIGSTSLVIWTRPRKASTNPPVTARAGSAHPVTNVSVPDLACVMRSRRT